MSNDSGKKNSQPSHTRISFSDKNVKKVEEKRLILFSQHFDFVKKNKGDCEIKENEISHEKIMCLFFGPNWA